MKLTVDSPEFRDLILQSASLRGERRFAEAIKLVESRLESMDDDCHSGALLELLQAAREAGVQDDAFKRRAVEFARQILVAEPRLPSARKTLTDWERDFG
jgi:hypothetical protein